MSAHPHLDQCAHVAAGAIALLPAAIAPGPLTFALAGLAMGLVREVTEEGALLTWATLRGAVDDRKSLTDLLFWTLGGAVAGLGAI